MEWELMVNMEVFIAKLSSPQRRGLAGPVKFWGALLLSSWYIQFFPVFLGKNMEGYGRYNYS